MYCFYVLDLSIVKIINVSHLFQVSYLKLRGGRMFYDPDRR